jgi:hypothetical protein
LGQKIVYLRFIELHAVDGCAEFDNLTICFSSVLSFGPQLFLESYQLSFMLG